MLFFYENKIKQYELQLLQSKYNSLQEVISKDQKEQSRSSGRNLLLWGISLVLLIGCALFFYFKFKKKKTTQINHNLQETYSQLITLLQNNDPGFMFSFENAFPYFQGNS
ncbi:hypothetical protein ACFOEQ_01835 [Chryseobacterium arachidis]|uniref:hypothetical protein n=1 Tax=Chryseobacterium arachidis TaxID=1416778 RepID=UPI00360E6B8A